MTARGWRHGTYSGYHNHGCRCQPCRNANFAYTHQRYTVPCSMCGKPTWAHGTKGRRAFEERGGLCRRCYARVARIVDVHGTETCYSRGCRCDLCRDAATRARQRRRAADPEAARAYDREYARRRRSTLDMDKGRT